MVFWPDVNFMVVVCKYKVMLNFVWEYEGALDPPVFKGLPLEFM